MNIDWKGRLMKSTGTDAAVEEGQGQNEPHFVKSTAARVVSSLRLWVFHYGVKQ